MQIVIELPDNLLKGMKIENGSMACKTILDAVYNGIRLPKGHGRLIDADELYGNFIDGTEGYDCNTWNRIEIGDIIEDAPTIIEADKEE